MKFQQMLIVAAVFLTACSSPKYVYHFDQYDYSVGKKTEVPAADLERVESPLKIEREALVAAADVEPVLTKAPLDGASKETAKSISEKYHAMSKAEKKEFKKELKNELKSLVKRDSKKSENVESVNRTKVFDTLVALSIVFGVAGIVLITLANISNAFWIIGAVSLAIGAVLFVKWVANGNG